MSDLNDMLAAVRSAIEGGHANVLDDPTVRSMTEGALQGFFDRDPGRLIHHDSFGHGVERCGEPPLSYPHLDPACPRCGGPTDPNWFCSEGYCPTCCDETDEGGEDDG
jgi:hypothetical protein